MSVSQRLKHDFKSTKVSQQKKPAAQLLHEKIRQWGRVSEHRWSESLSSSTSFQHVFKFQLCGGVIKARKVSSNRSSGQIRHATDSSERDFTLTHAARGDFGMEISSRRGKSDASDWIEMLVAHEKHNSFLIGPSMP